MARMPSKVKWVRKRDIQDGPFTFAGPDYDGVAVIPLADLAALVEGLQVIDTGSIDDMKRWLLNTGTMKPSECLGMAGRSSVQGYIAQRLLTQLEAHRKEGA